MVKNGRINKFLSIYSRILLGVFGISLLISGGILYFSDSPTCYQEEQSGGSDELYNELHNNTITADGCMMVEDIESIRKKYNQYKWISIGCMAGIMGIRIYNKKKNGDKEW